MTPSHRFMLDVEINSVACDVQVNDVPVVRAYAGDRTDIRLPVGEYIVPGRNTVAIRSLLDRSEAGKSSTLAKATLLASPYDRSDWQPLLSVRTRAMPGADGEATTEPQASALGRVSPQTSTYDSQMMLLENDRGIVLEGALPGWRWPAAPAIEDTEETRGSLIAWYRAFVGAISRGDAGFVRQAFAEKIAELSLAHRLAPEGVAFELGLERFMRDPNMQLSAIAWDELRVELGGYGRLARLYHPVDGAVVVMVNDLGIFHTFDFWLRRVGEGWVVAR